MCAHLSKDTICTWHTLKFPGSDTEACRVLITHRETLRSGMMCAKISNITYFYQSFWQDQGEQDEVGEREGIWGEGREALDERAKSKEIKKLKKKKKTHSWIKVEKLKRAYKIRRGEEGGKIYFDTNHELKTTHIKKWNWDERRGETRHGGDRESMTKSDEEDGDVVDVCSFSFLSASTLSMIKHKGNQMW